MILVGADLATCSAVCFGRPDTTPLVRAYRAPVTGDDYGAFGAFFWRAFNPLLRHLATQLAPDERIIVNLEAPILPREKWDRIKQRMVGQTNLQTTRKLHALGPLLETICTLLREDEGLPIDVYECHLASLKKDLGGHGGADKASMIYAARRAGIVLPEGKEAGDCADGFAAWLLCMRQFAPQHQQMWDRRLYSAGVIL